jgi:CheY-like chemotaxis protein
MTPHVLLIDDNPSFLSAELSQIRSLVGGVEISLIERAEEVETKISTLAENMPQVIVLDLLMPTQSNFNHFESLPDRAFDSYSVGFALIHLFRSSAVWKDTPIVICSALGEVQDLLEIQIPESFRSNIFICGKHESGSRLALLVASLISVKVSIHPAARSWAAAILDTLELKPGVFGLKVDLKKLASGRSVDA